MGLNRHQVRVRRNDVGAIQFDQGCLAGLLNGKARVRLQQVRKRRSLICGHLGHDDQGESAIGRYVLK